ncbi:hypothetical protein LCGC14_0432890 [marine sediment metagenome]|uniref:Uncharacterized protein n=1 Tax=marine sediment metagenome TaxID=412755 RepID=A0A0F9STX8_9ZZZZ
MKQDLTTLTQDFWLIFNKGENFFAEFFMKKGFGHIGILTRDKFNWFLLDPTYTELKIDILPFKPEDNVPRILLNKFRTHKIIKLTMMKNLHVNGNIAILKVFFPRVVSCVSMVKYIVGLKNNALTPYQLFLKLIKMKKNGISTYEKNILNIQYVI